MKMRQFVISVAFLGIVVSSVVMSGCASVGEFIAYGVCDDATLVVYNHTPQTLTILVGGDRKKYLLPPDGTLTIPGRYPISSPIRQRIPITASVTPFNSQIRAGTMTWDFYSSGYYARGYTYGREVHATVEFENPDPRAKTNRLVFRVQQ